MTLTDQALEEIAEGLAELGVPGKRNRVKAEEALAQILATVIKVADLEKRVAELEQRPAVRHCGVYAEGRRYVPGNLVTKSGSMWTCLKATKGVPGNSSHWQLVVKSGQAT